MSGDGTVNNYLLITDGAFSSSRNQMGIGLIFINRDSGKEILEYSRMYKGVSVIVGLRMIKKPIESLTICTDSEYVRGCASLGWKRKKNVKLWEEFDKQFERVKQLCPNVEFKHVKGHSGDKWNERADKLAVAASQKL